MRAIKKHPLLLTVVPAITLSYDFEYSSKSVQHVPPSDGAPATTAGSHPDESHQTSSLDKVKLLQRRLQSLSQGEPCISDFDCESFACARASADADAEKTCCEFDYFFTGPTLGNVCTNQPPGAPCLNNRDDLCESFVCVGDVCAAEQLEDGVECDNDSDCVSRKCGRRTATFDDRTQVCCAGGEGVDIFLMGTVCGDQALGAPCIEGTDGLCEGGMECMLGYCGGFVPGPSPSDGQPSDGQPVGPPKAKAGESCESRRDCENNVCGLESLSTANPICCPNGNATSAVCTNQPNGARCLDPRELRNNNSVPLDICASGYCCIPCGICKERLEAGEECQFDEDCIEGQCAPNGQGVRICCPGGTVTAVTGQCAVDVPSKETSSAAMRVGQPGILLSALTFRLIESFIWAK